MSNDSTLDKLSKLPKQLTDELQDRTSSLAGSLEEAAKRVTGTGEDAAPHHVVPRQEAWAVIEQGDRSPRAVLDTKEQAVDEGRTMARKGGSYLVVHRQDGTIQRVHTPPPES